MPYEVEAPHQHDEKWLGPWLLHRGLYGQPAWRLYLSDKKMKSQMVQFTMSPLRRLERNNLMKTFQDSQQAITSKGPITVAPLDICL